MWTNFFRGSFGIPLVMTGVMFAAITVGVYAKNEPMAMHAQVPSRQAGSALAEEQPFLKQNDTAMQKMMAGMAVEPTGDVDRDFVNMMVPHHQGAIDMAVLELRYGTSPRLKALAQEIVVTQQQEIAAMKLAVGEPIPPSHASPVLPSESHTHSNP